MIIYLGSIYPKWQYNELVRRKQFVDYPANVFQYSLLKGLVDHFHDLQIVTSPVIRARYSIVKDLCSKTIFSHMNSSSRDDVYVGTIPIPGVQLIAELWRVYWELRKKIELSNNKDILIVYALHSPFLLAATLLRKKIHCTCVVVPDLPEFMTGHSNLLRMVGKRIDRVIINFCIRRLDCFVLLSKYMRDKLPIKDKPWVLLEGIYDTSNIPEDIERCQERVIFYGGSLSKRYGIIELLEAFRGIENENYRLWICGDGDGKEYVIRMTEEDYRIKYLGIVSHDEVLALQQRATVLVNPRSSSGDYTKYSFPSKTMEYLASGTPTVMCHLPAIPAEYDDYIYYITDETAEGIRCKLLEVCAKSQQELDEFGRRASEFVKKEKSAFTQTKKMADLIASIN